MRHDVRAVIRWKVRSNQTRDEIERIATETILRALSSSDIPRFDVRVSSTHSREDSRVVKEMSWRDSVERIYRSKNSLPVKDRQKTHQAKMNPQRFFLFRENNFCVCCGAEGDRLLVEMRDADKSPHLNLYAGGLDGLTLMTRDHIQPKSLGGCDHLSNYQTMCSVCNSLKGHSNIRLSELASLRRFYDANRGKPKQELHQMVEAERHRISVPWSFGPHQSQAHIMGIDAPKHRTITDLSVYRSQNGGLIARAVFAKPDASWAYIGNIRRGMVFGALFSYKREVECQVGTSAVLVPKNLLKRLKAKENHGPAGKRKRNPRSSHDSRRKKRGRVASPHVAGGAAGDGSGSDVCLQEGRSRQGLVREPLQGGKNSKRRRPRSRKPAAKARAARARHKKKFKKDKNPGNNP